LNANCITNMESYMQINDLKEDGQQTEFDNLDQ
jgi:hypothetical protein